MRWIRVRLGKQSEYTVCQPSQKIAHLLASFPVHLFFSLEPHWCILHSIMDSQQKLGFPNQPLVEHYIGFVIEMEPFGEAQD